jgi:hypothetical protein
MILKFLCIALLFGGPSQPVQVAPPLGGWRQTNVTWQKPPAELELKQRYTEAAMLYFSSDHRFVLLYGTVIQSSTSEEISQGDGRVVYLGTWKLTDNSLHVEYRCVSRTVAKEGETLPGPIQSNEIKTRDGTLFFQKDSFRRDKKLDNELERFLQDAVKWSDELKTPVKR